VIHHEPKSHAATEVPDRLTAAQRWILFAASLAVGLAFLDETAVVTALRTIQRQFGASDSEVQWVMGSYLLALASLMAATGRIADLYGRRRLFIVGAALFGLGSLACAAAPSEEVLIASRALQGAGGALVIPLGMANATVPALDAKIRAFKGPAMLQVGALKCNVPPYVSVCSSGR
jgi:MFS family permease